MKQIYKINKYEEPKQKSYKDVKKYEVARFEYGDYDNWVNAIILDLKIENERCCKITFCTIIGMTEVCYSFLDSNKDCIFEIIGTAEKIKYNNNDQEHII